MKKDDNDLRSYKKIGMLLKDDLLSGMYQIGDRLPPERDIADFEYRKLWLSDHEVILNALQHEDPAATRKAMCSI
jgi:DNA-binding FadR family transcriptional regulator